MHRHGTLEEQLHGFRAGQELERRFRWWQAKRGNSPPDLATRAEYFSTGRQDPKARAAAQKHVRQVGARVYQVLAIVQDEEGRPGSEVVGEGVDDRLAR